MAWHVLCTGGVGPFTVTAWVTGHTLTLVIDGDAAVSSLDLNRGLHY